jgi:hypothetical protein
VGLTETTLVFAEGCSAAPPQRISPPWAVAAVAASVVAVGVLLPTVWLV